VTKFGFVACWPCSKIVLSVVSSVKYFNLVSVNFATCILSLLLIKQTIAPRHYIMTSHICLSEVISSDTAGNSIYLLVSGLFK
jgi:hypothetical protein